MSMLEDVLKLKEHNLALAILASSATIGPGILAIWFFDQELMKSSSAAKLVLLSLSFT
jgi:hypothetical protein